MRILHITHDYPSRFYVGGQGVVVREIALRMAAKGHDVRIIVPNKSHLTDWNLLPSREIDGALEIIRPDATSRALQIHTFRLIPPVIRATALAKSIRHLLWADLIHFHNFWGTGFLMPLLLSTIVLRRKYIFTPYYEDYRTIDPVNAGSYEKMFYLGCRFAKTTTVLSGREARIISSFTDRIAVTPPGVDPAALLDAGERPETESSGVPVVLSVGAMCRRKNFLALARAMAMIPDPWRLVIVSSRIVEPDYYEEIRKFCRLSGISDRVEVKINCSRRDLVSLYHSASLFVMPSLWESFGIAAAEAMFCGAPTVISRESMLTDFLEDGKNTVMVNAADDADIARAIQDLLDNRERAAAIGDAGKRLIAERFTWDRVAGNYERIYADAI